MTKISHYTDSLGSRKQIGKKIIRHSLDRLVGHSRLEMLLRRCQSFVPNVGQLLIGRYSVISVGIEAVYLLRIHFQNSTHGAPMLRTRKIIITAK